MTDPFRELGLRVGPPVTSHDPDWLGALVIRYLPYDDVKFGLMVADGASDDDLELLAAWLIREMRRFVASALMPSLCGWEQVDPDTWVLECSRRPRQLSRPMKAS